MKINRKNWGNSFNANRSAKMGEDVNKVIHSSSFFSGKGLDDYALTEILLNELSGTFKFETSDDFLLDNENTFWWNLFFYGRVGIYKIGDRFAVMNVNGTVYEYGEIVEARIAPAKVAFSQVAMSSKTPEKTIHVKGKDMDNLVIIQNGVTAAYFNVKFGWLVEGMAKIFEMYWTSNEMKMKKIGVYSNTKQQDLKDKLWDSFKDGTPYIEFESPMIAGDIISDSSVAMEKNFKFETLDFGKDGWIAMSDVQSYWKFGKDILGMNENAGETKERVISTEIEDSALNTHLMEEVQMRNYKSFSRHMKTKFSIIVDIIKTKDELEKVEDSKQAFTQGVGENENS